MRTRRELTATQLSDLGALVEGRITTNESILDLHGRDESAFPPVKPSAVITVHTTEEVSQVLKYCNNHDIPVVAFGAGTSLEGHVLPIYGGISLDLSAMDKILEIAPDDLTVRVQAGVKRMALNKKISSEGLFFSVDPGADATIGGMTSTGAAGTTTVRYGSMRENVFKLTAVLADGTIIHTGRETRKLSAGYDLTRLIVGSEGTLAIVTEISLRVFGIPEKMAAAVSRFPTLADGVQAAIAVVRSGVVIARCEFLDAQCIKNVNAHDGLNLEEAPTLLFEFHGSPRSVEEDAQLVQEIAADFGGTNFEWTSEEGARRKLWQARHNAYWAGMAAYPGKRAISTDAAVPLSKLAAAVELTEKILTQSPFPFSILGHVADGNFHAFIITDPNKPEELPAVRELTHLMTDAIIAMGGTCTGEHGIGAGKISSLEKEAGLGAMAVMLSIKNALDPKGILNPGKVLALPTLK
jgi:D-lactate dehydrogenase (cytochrome)